MEKKPILLICYGFPPNPGIGGRRWAKFAKHLAENNFEVHVICRKNVGSKTSEWLKDVQHSSILRYELNSRYPAVLLDVPNSFVAKVNYKLWLYVFRFLSKGTFPERTFFWKNQLLQTAGKLIQEKQIKNVIVSVPPFRLGYYASFLKLKFPEINFILDIRDPWTDNKTFHGFMNLAPKRMKHEMNMELQTIKLANRVISVHEQVTQQLKSKNPIESAKILTLINGYDSAEVTVANTTAKNTGAALQFIYAGTFYSNLEYILVPFLTALKKQEERNKAFPNQFLFSFYGAMDPAMRKLFMKFNLKSVKLYNSIGLSEIQNKIAASDFCMLFAAQDHAFAFNTKFYEYLANRKPIVVFSKRGQVPDFLKSNKLGFAIDFDNFETDFEQFIAHISNQTIDFNSTFNIHPFSTQYASQTLIEQLI